MTTYFKAKWRLNNELKLGLAAKIRYFIEVEVILRGILYELNKPFPDIIGPTSLELFELEKCLKDKQIPGIG